MKPLSYFMLAACLALATNAPASDRAKPATSNREALKSAGSSSAVAKKPVGPRYETRRHHDPDGIGKFYMGREIAHVMGYLGIDWLERPERETEEHIADLIDALKITPGMTVADLGAGSGLISVKLAQKVGPTGTVQAVDIQDEMLTVLTHRLKQLKITNVNPVRGTERSPELRPGSVDLVVMVDVYHEFRYPYEMLLAISKALKPGGRVAFVEYRKEDPRIPIKLVHKMTQAQVKREASIPELQLRYVETIGVLPRQHIIVFERRPEPDKSSKPPTPEKKPR